MALHVKGLINLQIAYKNDEVYVLEANPRSSRTIPFVSKATGLPLAKIAAKVIMGHSLQDLGYTREIIPRNVSVKEVLLPFDHLPGADPLLSPEMRSTGEVMGIDNDFAHAFFKAQTSAENELPLTGTVFISIRKADRKDLDPIARKMQGAGLHLICTQGTAKYLHEKGIQTKTIKKVSEGEPNIVNLIQENKIQLIINTPTSRQSRSDGYQIRRAAVDYKIPYITTIQAAQTAANAIIAIKLEKINIKSLQEYHRENKE